MNKKGYLDGRILSMAFNALRPNDLIWPYFINNYLLNKALNHNFFNIQFFVHYHILNIRLL
jgi:poly(3-hydroxyalkanoate) synthetase